MAPALSFALQVLTLLPSLIKAGSDIVTLLQNTSTALAAMQAEDREPTEDEWAVLHAASEDVLSRLDAASG